MGFITRITEYINKNYDLTKDSLLVIFPNKRAALTLRKELSKSIKCNIWLPQMLSIQEAMSAWSKLQLLDNIDVTFELLKILDNSDKSQTRNNLYGLASQMVKDFDEIDQYAVNAEKIFKYLKDIKEIESWLPDDNELSKTESAYLNFFKSLFSYYTKLRTVLLNDKSAYYGMSKSLALELATNNITVNVINPGWVDTELINNENLEEDFSKDEIIETIPQRRFVEPQEIASVCEFLISDKAKTITGQSINICAGLSLGF